MAETANSMERCPACSALIALVGRVHNCRPRAASPVPPQVPKPKLSGGAAVKVKRDPLLSQGAGPAPAKLTKARAKKGEATYSGYRDPDARRAYQRDLMKKRRAKEPA